MQLDYIQHGDCLELMKNIPDASIDLVLIDPPYNIKKAKWDKFKTTKNYVDFMGSVFLEIQRVLKDNGSFYFFHNDFLQIVELQNYINKNTNFIFKQFLVWNKRFNESKNKGFLDGFCEVEGLRNYQLMAEYCLYYTFQDETGLTGIYANNELFATIKTYLNEQKGKLTNRQINELLEYPSSGGGYASHYFTTKGKQWAFITQEHYEMLQRKTGKFTRTYENLRQEYESLRYTFNNLKQHHSVMNYEVAKKQGHITPKPIDLLEYLIKTSSNEGDIVLDCFMGGGSTCVAAINTNRHYIGFELDEGYFDIAKKRIEQAQKAVTVCPINSKS